MSFPWHGVIKMTYNISKHNWYSASGVGERILKLRIISAHVLTIIAMGVIFSHCLNPQTFSLLYSETSASCHSCKSKICKYPSVENKGGWENHPKTKKSHFVPSSAREHQEQPSNSSLRSYSISAYLTNSQNNCLNFFKEAKFAELEVCIYPYVFQNLATPKPHPLPIY